MSDLPPPDLPPPPEPDRPAGGGSNVMPYPAFPPTERDELPTEGPGSPVSVPLRFGGAIIDYLIVTLISAVVGPLLGLKVVTGSGKNATATVEGPLWVRVLLSVLPVLFVGLFLTLRGQTPGMMLLRMRLIRYLDGTPPSAQQAFTRTIILFAPLLVLSVVLPIAGLLGTIFIGISALFDKVWRGVHDKASGTILLRTV